MDPWGYDHMDPLAPAGREDVRRAMGAACRLAAELDLAGCSRARTSSAPGLRCTTAASTAVVYQPYEDRLCLNVGRSLEGATVEWRDLVDDGKREPGSIRPTGDAGLIDPPWPGPAIAIITLDARR